MKNVYYFLIIFCFSLIIMANSGGRANEVGQGTTTAPGESGQYCGSFGCHGGISIFETEVNLMLTDTSGNAVMEYQAGEDYIVNIKIGHNGFPAGYGFQIVSLQDNDDTGVNNFHDLPRLTQEVLINDRQYVEHSRRLSVDSLSLMWTAPLKGTGDVTFYVAANSVNGDRNTSGDSADTTRLTIVEERISNVNSASVNTNINIFPNPANDVLFISSEAAINNVHIIDINGAIVKKIKEEKVNIDDLPQGIYYIDILTDEKQRSVSRLIKY